MPADDLVRIDDGLWCLNSYFVTLGCKGSLRMTVIKTAEGLIIYSPVVHSPENLEQIGMLGNVFAIVAPNLFHHFHLRTCIKAFPAARAFVPDGLQAKIGQIERAETMEAFPESADIVTCTVAGHRLNETVLFHRSTGTLVTADLLYNYQAEHFAGEKLFFKSIGCYGKASVAFYHRFAITDGATVRSAIAEIASWPIRRIIMSHGRIVEHVAAQDIFSAAWRRIIAS